MKINVKGAYEQLQTDTKLSDALHNVLEPAQSIADLNAFAVRHLGMAFNHTCYYYVVFPLIGKDYILGLITSDYDGELTLYSVVGAALTSGGPRDIASQLFSGVCKENSNIFRFTPEELEEIRELLGAPNYTDEQTYTLDLTGTPYFYITDDYVDEMLPQIKEEFKNYIKTYLEGRQQTSASVSIDQALLDMHRTGGIQTVAGKTGYVVEIFTDYTAGKLRARANDGSNGLMNVRFPNAARQRDAVYVVPASDMKLANNCYSIANSVPLDRYRVR